MWLRQRAATATTAAQALPLAQTTHPTLAATPAATLVVEWPAMFQALRPTGSLVLLMARTPTATALATTLVATRVMAVATLAATLVVG